LLTLENAAVSIEDGRVLGRGGIPWVAKR
jgi:hypothetical protein